MNSEIFDVDKEMRWYRPTKKSEMPSEHQIEGFKSRWQNHIKRIRVKRDQLNQIILSKRQLCK